MESSKKHILSSAAKILKENMLLTLATTNSNHPCSCTAFYAFDKNFNIYIWTSPDTLHGRNMENNEKVAVSIFSSAQKWGSMLRGVQIIGRAEKIGDNELEKAGNLYLKRFPKAKKYAKNPKDFHDPKFEGRFYKIQPHEIKVLDEKTFGKENYQSIKL